MKSRLAGSMKSAAIIVTVAIAASCSGRLGDFTAATNKNIVISSFDTGTMESTEAEGKDCKAIILLIPTGTPNIESALDKALSKVGGNFMTDAVMTWNYWSAIVYGQHCFTVRGNVWTLRVAEADSETLETLASSETPVLIHLKNGDDVVGNMVGFGSEIVVLRNGETGQLQRLSRSSIGEIESIESAAPGR